MMIVCSDWMAESFNHSQFIIYGTYVSDNDSILLRRRRKRKNREPKAEVAMPPPPPPPSPHTEVPDNKIILCNNCQSKNKNRQFSILTANNCVCKDVDKTHTQSKLKNIQRRRKSNRSNASYPIFFFCRLALIALLVLSFVFHSLYCCY